MSSLTTKAIDIMAEMSNVSTETSELSTTTTTSINQNSVTILILLIGLNLLFAIIQGFNQVFGEKVKMDTVSDKCVDRSARFSYLIHLRYDPRRKQDFKEKNVTITIDLSDSENRHITRFTITPEIMRKAIFVHMSESLIKMKLLRMNGIPAVGYIKLNHNMFEGYFFVYSLEIQDVTKRASYLAQINREIHSHGPTGRLNVQSFQCTTKTQIAISDSIIPQNLFLSEFVFFVYLALTFVLFVPVYLKKEWKYTDDMKMLGSGVIGALLGSGVSGILLLIYRFDIKVRYSLASDEPLWISVRVGYLMSVFFIGFVLGAVSVYLSFSYQLGDKYIYYAWAIGWVTMLVVFVVVAFIYMVSNYNRK